MNKQTTISCAGIIVSLIMIFPGIMPGCQKAESSVRYSEGFVQAGDDLELYYRIAGSGPDTLIMLHGGPGLSFDYLAPDLTPLEEHFTLIYYDQRGAGRSTIVTDPEMLHIDRHIDDLEAVRRYFGIASMNIFAHSWGPLPGARYALKHPEQVSKLIIAGPIPLRSDPYHEYFFPRVMAWMDSTTVLQMNRLMDAFQNPQDNEDIRSICRDFFELFKRGYFYDPHDLDTYRRMKGDFCSAPEPALRRFWDVNTLTMESIGEYDWRNDFQDIRVPVLIIVGEKDVDPSESYMEWEDAFPKATLVTLERAGHYPQIERPEGFFRTVMEFMEDS